MAALGEGLMDAAAFAWRGVGAKTTHVSGVSGAAQSAGKPSSFFFFLFFPADILIAT